MPAHIQFDIYTASNLSWRGLTAWTCRAISRWRERRIMEMLDERMLRDMGISRSQALAEARKPCWRL